jgi:SAM-dependent methyltransferase
MSIHKSSGLYNVEFFLAQSDGSLRSAQVILGHVLELISPASVVDVGCGSGGWISVLLQHGITDALGVDYPTTEAFLSIPTKHFLAQDLEKTMKIERRFDLAMSLEVAEHLPSSSADNFVSLLTSLSSRVLFSAAVPHQAGCNHQNEQWQSYWQAKFELNGFYPFDVIRPLIWNDARVKTHYRQNVLLYLNEDISNDLLKTKIRQRVYPALSSVVHPDLYLCFANPNQVDLRRIGLKRLLLGLPGVVANSLLGRMRRRGGREK